MANYMSMDHLRFLMHEVHHLGEIISYDKFQDLDIDSIDMLLEAAKSWADQEWYPYFREMDEKPAYFKENKVFSHPQLKKIFKDAGENGWIGMYFDYKHGGMQLPYFVALGVNHIFESANNHITGYLGLTAGSADLITTFGNQELIDQYVPKMLAGTWGGTMCLTEPQAGSSLSDVKTAATLQADGSYKISGQKIFISGGDHEATENIIHLTLARIDGAPKGTKGISLFVVPKFRIKADGSFEHNDVITAGDFQKLGQRGYSTVHLSFGEQDDCQGFLLGEANMGLKYMFQMMNGARLEVGMSAASTATAAYYASLQYAKERPQGRRIEDNGRKNISEEQTLIINHADVRRMLFLQKAIVEGSLSLLMEAAYYQDKSKQGPEEERKDNHLLMELLMPIAKTYPSERGKVAIDNGLQVLGGYGFCMDFVLQQYYRDVRIMSIYEGTTGIQSIDLLGRKIPMENGKALLLLMEQIQKVITEAGTFDDLTPYATQLTKSLGMVQKALTKLTPIAMEGDHERYLSDATIFMDMASNVVVAYQWLKMATIAKQALVTGQGLFDAPFYESKVHTMKFYFKYELPRVSSCLETLLMDDSLTIVNEQSELLV
ncbi:MAG TPA: acyl-CoA dehydrogenase [Saprospiraceae bacterium]|nr:acyl-CoA dehydrogenase [Saprospiraceae bacterium]